MLIDSIKLLLHLFLLFIIKNLKFKRYYNKLYILKELINRTI